MSLKTFDWDRGRLIWTDFDWYRHGLEDKGQEPPIASASALDFPSLEHGRLAFPRPRPTSPIFLPKDQKGKGRADREQDDDFVPSSEDDEPSLAEVSTIKDRG